MTLSSSQRNNAVFLAAAALIGISSVVYVGAAGNSDESLGVLLRASARIALLTLLVVFVARPLRQLFATPFTLMLLRNRRLLGVAFAGFHTAHLVLLILKANQVADFNLDPMANPLGVLTYIVILALLVTSYDGPARALGAKRWKILHKTGLYWLFVTFAQTQLPESIDNLEGTNWWLLSLVAIALVIRLTAYFAKRK